MNGKRESDEEQELRALFREWFQAAAAKDIDGAMKPIADDVVSYEHEAPLQYVGADNVRQVCQRGFDSVGDNLRWDVPDLRIEISGDMAVTWGLNRMRSQQQGASATESWSRGTRIFRRIGGDWKMVHQHVSFPYDPQSGGVAMDLRP
jgi:ketosteroid isomerase-like protein